MGIVVAGGVIPRNASAIPAFARRYGVACSSCHTEITRRGDFGDAFWKAGYRWPTDVPENGVDPAAASSIEMRGASGLPALLPLSMPIAASTTLSGSYSSDPALTEKVVFGSPSLTFLFGGPLGNHVAFFGTWLAGSPTPNDMALHFARIFGRRALNLRVGLFEPMTSLFRRNEALLGKFLIGASPLNGFSVAESRLTAELEGTLGHRTFYAMGAARAVDGANKGYFAHVSHRFGGMSFRGEDAYVDFDHPRLWDDVTLTVGAWGLIGSAPDTAVRRFGLDGKLSYKNAALWGGAMLGLDRNTVLHLPNRSMTILGELSYGILPGLIALYTYQVQDSAAVADLSQEHALGAVYLIIENLRVRAKAAETLPMAIRTAELQVLYAF
jgi:hypothetical protein